MSRRKAEYANTYDTNFIRSISSGREPYGDYWKDNYLYKWSDPGQKTWTDSITTNSPWRVYYPAYPLELPVIDMEPKQKPKPQPKKPTIEPTPSTGTRRFFLDD